MLFLFFNFSIAPRGEKRNSIGDTPSSTAAPWRYPLLHGGSMENALCYSPRRGPGPLCRPKRPPKIEGLLQPLQLGVERQTSPMPRIQFHEGKPIRVFIGASHGDVLKMTHPTLQTKLRYAVILNDDDANCPLIHIVLQRRTLVVMKENRMLAAYDFSHPLRGNSHFTGVYDLPEPYSYHMP